MSKKKPQSGISAARKKKVARVSAARRAKKRRGRKPAANESHASMKIGEAMRVFGLDEIKVAQKFLRLVIRLDKKEDLSSAKILLETLKDCCKHLAPPAVARLAGPAGAAPDVPVQLVHFVSRPDRDPSAAPADASAESLAEVAADAAP